VPHRLQHQAQVLGLDQLVQQRALGLSRLAACSRRLHLGRHLHLGCRGLDQPVQPRLGSLPHLGRLVPLPGWRMVTHLPRSQDYNSLWRLDCSRCHPPTAHGTGLFHPMSTVSAPLASHGCRVPHH
jgi:hypothetical protein